MHRPNHRKLPRPLVLRIDRLDAVVPWRDVDVSALSEVDQDRSRMMHQREYTYRTVRGRQIEIRHATAKQWMSLAKIVMNAEAGHFGRHALPRFVDAEQLGDEISERLCVIVRLAKH